MQHEDMCKSWASFHPYECPECKIIVELIDTEGIYSFEEIEKIKAEAYDDGYQEAEWGMDNPDDIREQALQDAMDAVRSLM
jgi:hypothetical protein